MVDESRFRYRRDEGAAEGGQRPRSAPSSAATGGDPLAELARLIGDDDPFDDFSGLDRAPQDRAPQAADTRVSDPRTAPRQVAPAAPAYPDPRAAAARAPARPAPQPAPSYYDDEDDEEWEAPPRSVPAPSAVSARPAPQSPAQVPPAQVPARSDAARYGDAPSRPAPAVPPRPAGPPPYAQPSAPQPAVPAARAAQPQAAPSFAPAPAAGRGVPDAAVRSGYGSLSRVAPPASGQGRDEDDYDDDYDDVPPTRPAGASAYGQQGGYAPSRQDPRADQRAHAGASSGAHGRGYEAEDDEAGYAYSAARRDDDGYDDYDDTYDPEYGEDGYMPPHGEEMYDAEPRRRKGRLALILGVSVLGLAVAGAAGVFAFNMATGKSSGTAAGTTPVIKADTAPAKTATPAPQSADGGQKMIYDRMGANAGNERMVSREEQPVDVTAAARALPANTSATPPAPMQATQNLTEPKRVRTVAVRADGSLAQTVPGTSVSAYAATQNPIPAGLPDPNPVTTVPAVAPTQTASTTTAPSSAGAYVVQVASQRSEADAMGSWRALQTKYPNLLGNYRATVKKVDLADKGTYFRAQVGPFATRDQANELCQSLRAQGGDCVVNKN
ncbi:SPOR domain-containing protein [Xanthobacter oligotrophicus]|uniref:SPOR domain-containing protein n=1 Tax=Xanthobacter oligotrophicus TaxID=2607286 RepID=UPI0011F263D6|nr:SPOR domain-containing protein [Xanthobacter oligotrophicus]MCG5233862.1 SPOR domain-containing protein [Xanthobacter oligotrophicus]